MPTQSKLVPGSTGAMRHLPRSRGVALVPLALVFATQLAACQAVQTTDALEPLLENAVSLMGTSNGTGQVPLKAAPGLISFDVEVTWSNGASDKTVLGLHALPASELLVLAYERGHGVLPAKINLPRPAPSHASSAFWGALNYCGICFAGVILTAPIWLPIWLSTRDRPGLRPGLDCCFVWVEDVKTGEIVAGNSPWQEIAIPANTPPAQTPPAQPEAPPATGEDLVNCMSGGSRKWVYQSRCD